MKKVVAALIVMVILIAAIVIGLDKRHNDKNPSTNNTPAATQTTNQPNSTESTAPTSASTITYTDKGFSPSTLTAKAGTTVTLKNDSSSSVKFSSDPHPVHTDDPELNQDELPAGQTQTFKVTVTGTHGYHNHDDPSQTGTLIVQ